MIHSLVWFFTVLRFNVCNSSPTLAFTAKSVHATLGVIVFILAFNTLVSLDERLPVFSPSVNNWQNDGFCLSMSIDLTMWRLLPSSFVITTSSPWTTSHKSCVLIADIHSTRRCLYSVWSLLATVSKQRFLHRSNTKTLTNAVKTLTKTRNTLKVVVTRIGHTTILSHRIFHSQIIRCRSSTPNTTHIKKNRRLK